MDWVPWEDVTLSPYGYTIVSMVHPNIAPKFKLYIILYRDLRHRDTITS